MENQKSQTQQLILNYGLILGFVSVVYAIIRYAKGKHLENDWTVSVISFDQPTERGWIDSVDAWSGLLWSEPVALIIGD